jgi:hypothetical protein
MRAGTGLIGGSSGWTDASFDALVVVGVTVQANVARNGGGGGAAEAADGSCLGGEDGCKEVSRGRWHT